MAIDPKRSPYVPSVERKKTQEESIRLSVVKRTYDLLTAALTFVAALAWNDAIQSLFQTIFGPASTLAAKFIYAIILTIIIVWLGSRIARLTQAIERRYTSTS